jgi:hypothetical protein
LENANVAGHSHLRLPAEEPGDFGPRTARVAAAAKVAGAAGILLALVLGFFPHDYFRTFYFAYLAAWGFFLAVALGALFFVLIQHVSRAGWSVNVRRVAENFAALLPILGVLSLPIFVSVAVQKGDLYRWALPASAMEAEHEGGEHAKRNEVETAGSEELASLAGNQQIAPVQPWQKEAEFKHEPDPGHGNRHIDEITWGKRNWLNPLFFCVRLVVYFTLWSVIALYYLRQSTQQDADGDYRHTSAMQKYSGISLVIFGLSLTTAAYDIFMSLDPHWYSTMFGVYYFAGGVQSFFAMLALLCILLQRGGYLREAVTREHYHDIGKFLFAFTFFWGYIAFAQYMLLWYSSIPEEVTWWARRGASSAQIGLWKEGQSWIPLALICLFGCLLIPFAGLLSRHVKRNTTSLAFWCVWVLFFQFCNLIWIVLPEMRQGFRFAPVGLTILAFIGIGGVLTASWLKLTASSKVRPMNDPRAFESAAFVNI